MFNEEEKFVRTIVLLSLVFVDGGDNLGKTEKRILGASMLEDILDQGALTCVSCEDADTRRRISKEAHILVDGNGILCLSEVLDKMRSGF
jgi:hypothetical protein